MSRRQRIKETLGDLKGADPRDLAKWLFWVKLRDALDPDRPEQVARFFPLWRAQHQFAGKQKALMADEYRRWLGDSVDVEPLIREAYRVAFRVHFEELMLGKLNAQTVQKYMVFEGRENLDAALARGKGVVLLNPHAGNIMMMIAALSLGGYKYNQYAARGMAPPEVAAANPEVFGINRWRQEVRDVREANEDNLPANFLTLNQSARELYRRLKANEIVGIAFDGRIGKKFVKVPYINRQALLNSGPYRLAASTGAAIVPALCSSPDGAPNVLTLGEPIIGDDPDVLIRRFLSEAVEPWLNKNPHIYGIWLTHCRERSAVDDHPFFVDYAPDDRWKKYDR
ncbi:MAG: lysophospholipid acyltransferase family protein [Myxococcota bacterium]|nr:lysophospholipid acyltransferase family protein [Myxococcota bacterium]